MSLRSAETTSRTRSRTSVHGGLATACVLGSWCIHAHHHDHCGSSWSACGGVRGGQIPQCSRCHGVAPAVTRRSFDHSGSSFACLWGQPALFPICCSISMGKRLCFATAVCRFAHFVPFVVPGSRFFRTFMRIRFGKFPRKFARILSFDGCALH